MTIGAVILAAGQSRRFGGDKRRHLLADTISKYQSAFSTLRVVLRPNESDFLAELGVTLRTSDSVVHARDAHLGMGHSLAAGVQALAWRGLFVGLGDMPFVQTSTLKHLIQSLSEADNGMIIRPTYNGAPGQPVGFGSGYFAALSQLVGDEGARALIQANTHTVRFIEVEDPGIVEDIDTPEAMRRHPLS